MTRQLVFIHGRSQQSKDPVKLKKTWVDAWKQGLQKSGLEIPIAESDIKFPFYGDTLAALTEGLSPNEAARIVIRGTGDGVDPNETEFVRGMLMKTQELAGITDQQVQDQAEGPVEKGIGNWEWIQNIVEAIDTHVPGASGAAIALATRDVYKYINNDGIQNIIDEGVAKAVTPGVETIVVGHSLGAVVSYHLLKTKGNYSALRISSGRNRR